MFVLVASDGGEVPVVRRQSVPAAGLDRGDGRPVSQPGRRSGGHRATAKPDQYSQGHPLTFYH